MYRGARMVTEDVDVLESDCVSPDVLESDCVLPDVLESDLSYQMF